MEHGEKTKVDCNTSLILTCIPRMKSPSHTKRSVAITLSGSPLNRGYYWGWCVRDAGKQSLGS